MNTRLLKPTLNENAGSETQPGIEICELVLITIFTILFNLAAHSGPPYTSCVPSLNVALHFTGRAIWLLTLDQNFKSTHHSKFIMKKSVM